MTYEEYIDNFAEALRTEIKTRKQEIRKLIFEIADFEKRLTRMTK